MLEVLRLPGGGVGLVFLEKAVPLLEEDLDGGAAVSLAERAEKAEREKGKKGRKGDGDGGGRSQKRDGRSRKRGGKSRLGKGRN